MYCQDCGMKLSENDRFCGACGAERSVQTSPPATPTGGGTHGVSDESGQQSIPPTPQPTELPAAPPVQPTAQPTPPGAPVGQPAAPPTKSPGRPWTIGAFACAGIAVFAVPILFGSVGAILGWQGKKRGDNLGQGALWAAIAGGVLGFIVNLMLIT